MTFEVKIIEDSINDYGNRLTTFQLRYPKYIHAELMTHRMFSRSASSSRAIPVAQLATAALDDMVFPIRWGMNQAGMQAKMEDLSPEDIEKAHDIWERTAKVCIGAASELSALGLHKQWSNRLLEWFGHISVVVTATEYDNFFHLRCHPDAQPEIQQLANMMKAAYETNTPKLLQPGEWHLPYITEEERSNDFFKIEANKTMLQKISSARCARVSYMKHDGTLPNIDDDLFLFTRLAGSVPAHMSPLEHSACCSNEEHFYMNLKGFISYRYFYETDNLSNLESR